MESKGPKARILVVDDEFDLANAIATALRENGYSARVEVDGLVSRETIQNSRPDLVILDLMLPGMDGITLGRFAINECQIPVIFMSARDSDKDKIEGLSAGAEDYLAKPFVIAELILRVRAVLRRVGIVSPPLLFGDLRVDEDRFEVSTPKALLPLTTTEYKLLVELVRSRNQVLSKTYLLTQVWGYDAFDPNLVEVHLSSLRKKMDSGGSEVRIETRRGFGYLLTKPEKKVDLFA